MLAVHQRHVLDWGEERRRLERGLRRWRVLAMVMVLVEVVRWMGVWRW